MTSLMIKDLAASTELDKEAMAGVAGGHRRYLMPVWGRPLYKERNITDIDRTTFTADQFIGQEQNVSVATGVNAAFVSGLKSVVKPTQNADNNISFG